MKSSLFDWRFSNLLCLRICNEVPKFLLGSKIKFSKLLKSNYLVWISNYDLNDFFGRGTWNASLS